MKRFPIFRQFDSMDCGPTCVKMIAKWYGKSYALQYLRERTHIGKNGVTMLGICDAAENIGLKTNCYRLSYSQLQKIPLPLITFWNKNHFVVVYKIDSRKGKIYIADPAQGKMVYSKKEFLHYWAGTESNNTLEGLVVSLTPTPQFYSQDITKSKSLGIDYLLNYLRPYKSYVVQLILGMLVGSVISMILPFLTQAIVDFGIGNSDIPFIVLILIAQLLLTFGEIANNLIRNWIMLHLTTRFSITIISDFLMKLMKLPISFFDSKRVGDIMQRIDDHKRIQTFLTGTLISMTFAFITFIVYTSVMATYHVGIIVVFIIGSALYIGWIAIFQRRRRSLDYLRFQEASVNQSNIVQLVNGMQEIKLNNCEKQKRWEWERIQAKLFKVSLKAMALQQNQQIGGAFVDEIKNILISFMAATAVVNGSMTLGMMMAVQYIIGQLNAPLEQFLNFMKEAQDAKISIERLEEIHNKKDEEEDNVEYVKRIPVAKAIQVKNMSFRYEGSNSPRVLDNINLDIPAGKMTAIVGTSGSGKTTLIKLLLGFYKPEEGEILVNGIKLSRYKPQAWRQECGTVMQEGYIFSDSFFNNIGISDEIPDRDEVEKAATTANINELIRNLPLGYDTKIGSEGHGLSSGQKQRVLIARAVYKKPSYIFLDEATNSLDANNEKIIMEKLNLFFEGRTVIVVAHRLSTVKNADQIVVMDMGRIIEQGSHDELVSKRGAYYNLVKNQLELGN